MSRGEDQRIRTSEKAAEEDEVALPGFRFHPTDEELVGFYLRRKVEKKALPVELIKQIDIYKYDPWDLPKSTCTSTCCDEDTELYLFSKRGRKYRNSIRPNRVTGSGFWKATGIDKPVNNTNRQCIGLKKTLVYYRGSAGKGNKTDWMMHEFRLPTAKSNTPGLQEAEVWTICRIFKRNIVSHQKYTADWREIASKRHSVVDGSKACSSLESRSTTISATTTRESYISFGRPDDYDDYKASGMSLMSGNWPSSIPLSMTSSAACIDTNNNDIIADHDLFTHVNWEELTSLVHFALDPPLHL